jgi:hypothetical protein
VNQRTGLHLALTAASVALAFFAFYTCLDNEASIADALLLRQAQQAHADNSVAVANASGSWHRPLAQAFLVWEYRVWGLEFALYLLLQVVLHAVNAALVFALFRYPVGTPVAAASAMLFAIGVGFYGTAVFSISAIDQMLALTCVLAAGVAAARAQLLRTAGQRTASMLLASLLFLAGLASHELAIMALVVIGGYMWPNRRSAFSLIRKLALLVLTVAAWITYQWHYPGSGPDTLLQASSWLWMPWRTLQLASWMVVPVDTGLLVEEPTGWMFRMARLLEQTRPVYGLAIGAAMGWWFWRGSGAFRWLLASWVAFLVPVALLASTEPTSALSPHDVYLAAPFLCGLLALMLRRFWLSTAVFGRSLAAVALSFCLTGDLLLIRIIEQRAAERGTTPAARAAQELLRGGQQPPVPATPDSGALSYDQKSVPMATLEADAVLRTSGSYIHAQSNLSTKLPRLTRLPTP